MCQGHEAPQRFALEERFHLAAEVEKNMYAAWMSVNLGKNICILVYFSIISI